jgi:DNA processing protein
MIGQLTANTQAILLLTAPLLVPGGSPAPDLLSLGEYNRLARALREKGCQPSDLSQGVPGAVTLAEEIFGHDRLEPLLGRGFLLSQAVERWSARAIWVLSRADTEYPQILKSRLREDAPPVLYGCGDLRLAGTGGLAVVGSRHVDDSLIDETMKVGALATEANLPIISGGAKGVDKAAIRGALGAGGRAIAVMADSMERAATATENREPIVDARLLLLSPYDPGAGFNVGNAMQRNKVVYALADAGLVMVTDFEKGGTWAGAIEQLDRRRTVPLFVRDVSNSQKGNTALIHRGGTRWPNPQSPAELTHAIAQVRQAIAAEPLQASLALAFREEPPTAA